MARPHKQGLEYFSLDVDIFEDEKIEAIAGEFGVKGELAVIKLLCAIYKKGYFILWNDLTQATILKRLPGVSKDMINSLVNRLVLWEFFDKDLFYSTQVLTSKNIQARYFEAIKRRKTPKPNLYVIDVNNNSLDKELMSTLIPKVKESKEKESKVNNYNMSSENSHLQQIVDFCESNGFGVMNPTNLEDIRYYLEGSGFDLLKKALSIAAREHKPLGYAYGCLKNWKNDGLDTLEKQEAFEREFEQKKAKPAYKSKLRVVPEPSWSNPDYKELMTDEEVEAFKMSLKSGRE